MLVTQACKWKWKRAVLIAPTMGKRTCTTKRRVMINNVLVTVNYGDSKSNILTAIYLVLRIVLVIEKMGLWTLFLDRCQADVGFRVYHGVICSM